MALAWERNISITTPAMGQAFRLNQPERGQAWWLEVEPQPVNEHAAS